MTLKTARVVLQLYLLIAFTALWAQSDGLTTNPVYEKNCVKCHGKTATGRHFGGPPLSSDQVATASLNDLRDIITNGKGRMPKYAGKLTPEDINTVVKQIKALNKK
jgi:mono/diheme cytochrome c family protein